MLGFPTLLPFLHDLATCDLPSTAGSLSRLKQLIQTGALLLAPAALAPGELTLPATELRETTDLRKNSRLNFAADKFINVNSEIAAGAEESVPLPPPLVDPLVDKVQRFARDIQAGKPLDLTRLSNTDRRLIGRYLEEYFCAATPAGWQQHYDYFTYARLFRAIDQPMHDKECLPGVQEELKRLFDFVPSGYEAASLPHEVTDCRVQKISKVASLLPLAERDLCHAEINRLLKEFRERWGNDFPRFIAHDMAEIRRACFERESRAQQNFVSAIEKDYDSEIARYAASFIREGNHYTYVSTDADSKTEKWIVALEDADWQLPEPQRRLEERKIILRNSNAPEMMALIHREDFLAALSAGDLSTQLSDHVADYNARNAPARVAELEKIRPPEGARIAYLRVFPTSRDLVSDSNLVASEILAKALESRYAGRFYISSILFTDSPQADLTPLISELRRQGFDCFFVDFYNHGTANQIDFVEPITTSSLVTLADPHRDCQFYFMTIACYGGGLAYLYDEMLQNAKLAPHVSLLLPTKPIHLHRLAPAPMFNGDLQIYHRGTAWTQCLSRALFDHRIESLGGVLYAGDRDARLHSQFDPEFILGGNLYTQLPRTADIWLAGID